jgi:hypothetical protein
VSGYTFAELTWTQQLPDWIGSTLEQRHKFARGWYEKLQDEARVANDKAFDYCYDGIFWSAEKREKLDCDAEYARKRELEAWNDTVEKWNYVERMKKALAAKEGANA